MEQERGEGKQRYLKGGGGKLDQGVGALKKGGWNPLTNYGFTPCKAEQPLQGMELQEKEAQKG